MDILSRLFDEMHLQQVQYISVQASGEWQIEQSKQDYLTFIVVMSGELILDYDERWQLITANNMIMMTSQASYRCQSNGHIPSTTITHRVPAHEANQTSIMINATDDNEGIKQSTGQPQHNDQAQPNNDTTRFIIVRSQFDTDMARPLLSSLPNSLPPPTQQHSAYNEVVSIGLQFFQLEVSLQRPGKTTMLARLASMLMIECIREYVESLESSLQVARINRSDKAPLLEGISIENSGHWLMAIKDPYLSKTLYLMHSYPSESWTLQRLAKESGLSRSALSVRFKALIGITPQAYFSQYRLRLAARHLRQEQYSISKISELVGYASDHSFSGAFKRRYGQSPSHYRRDYVTKGSDAT